MDWLQSAIREQARLASLFLGAASTFLVAVVAYTFMRADPNIRFGVVSASLALIGTVGSVGISHFLLRDKEIKALLREKKVPIYTSIFDLYLDMFAGAKGLAKPKNANELARAMHLVSKNTLIWGSEEVLKQWSEMRRVSEMPNVDANERLFLMTQNMHDLFRAIRHDLGHEDRSLTEEEYLRIFLAEDVLAMIRSRSAVR